MGNVAGEQGLALQQRLPYNFPYSLKLPSSLKLQTDIKSHLFKFGHFDILDMLFPFLAFVKL